MAQTAPTTNSIIPWVAVSYVGALVLTLLAIATLQAPPREANTGHWTAMLLATITVGILALARLSVYQRLTPHGGVGTIWIATATEAICAYFTFTRLWNVSHGLVRPEDPTISLSYTLMRWFGAGIVVILLFIWVTRRRDRAAASDMLLPKASNQTVASHSAANPVGDSSGVLNSTDRTLLVTAASFAGVTALVALTISVAQVLQSNFAVLSDASMAVPSLESMLWNSARISFGLAAMIIGRFAFYWSLARQLEARLAVTVILCVEVIAPYMFLLFGDAATVTLLGNDIFVALFPATLVGFVPFGTVFVTAGVGAAALGITLGVTHRRARTTSTVTPG